MNKLTLLPALSEPVLERIDGSEYNIKYLYCLRSHMKYICTTCSKEKRHDKALLPANQRYISGRISFVISESQRLSTSLLILSGKYGLIDVEREIPWYDQKLVAGDLETLVNILVKQLQDKQVSEIIFYGRSREIPDWKPYYDVLEQSCRQLNVTISYVYLS
ncbi:hypothetical protein IQ270_03750 [Microcoleus sp. LEGE 07076]|uniref:hypothetical protein n=1 Tax=Microcoleus sp. LEGE 07076 TaxID=915322 RepID=UPI00188174FC|nr:hypothetical protein [Microcoleus sp. LEGE 07076]MBE9183860.1 hypothetical protein [Microcoleus sp. LEGE 07076]